MNKFKFDINAKRIRITNDQILSCLQDFATKINYRYFSSTEFNKWSDRTVESSTVIDRFGSWNKALKILGIEGGRERRYDAEVLIQNLEDIWKQLGYPPGKRQVSKLGLKISETPYKNIWGSVRNACCLVAKYHEGKISREILLKGNLEESYKRRTIPLNIRWAVLKRDNYTCVKCGKSPAKDRDIDIEVDHIKPIAKGGTNEIDNLQVLCNSCNQGKKDKL